MLISLENCDLVDYLLELDNKVLTGASEEGGVTLLAHQLTYFEVTYTC